MNSTTVDTGHTAWILVCMALVQLMLPGLAFFYSGLLGANSVITMIMQNYACMGIVTVLWFGFAFSLCFGEDRVFYGDISTFWGYKDVDGYPLVVGGETFISDIPGLLFAGYQGMFAVITPALMTGAFADRIRFGPYLVFIALWLLIVYCPFVHWIWGPNGWLANWGVKDFAGGIVVHTTAGFSSLAAINVLGSRTKLAKTNQIDTAPHNIPFVALGTALLWFGWFGFNGGSALAAGGSSAYAAVNSEIAASTALCVWVAIDWIRGCKPTLIGLCVGAIAGLATITPAAGFVRPWGAFVLGIMGSLWCYGSVELVKLMAHRFPGAWDDALDVWGVHGMGGALGSVMIGALAVEEVAGFEASGELFGKQLAAVALAAVYSYVMAALLLLLMGMVCRLTPTAEEITNLDAALHGEAAYSPEIKLGSGLDGAPNLDLEGPEPSNLEGPEPSNQPTPTNLANRECC